MRGIKIRRSSLVFIMLILFAELAVFHLVSIVQASDTWADPNLAYCQSITFTSAAGADTNYQMPITLVNSSGTSSSNVMYSTHFESSSFYDVRFYASDNTTLLDCWQENATSQTNATYWIEINGNLTASNQQIFVYYGNSSYADPSNGANTFLFFDDFETYTININLAGQGGWTDDGGTMQQVKVNTNTVYHGAKAINNTGSNSNVQTSQPSSSPKDFRAVFGIYASVVTSYGPGIRMYNATSGGKEITVAFVDAVTSGKMGAYNGSWVDLGSISASTWYRLECQVRSSDYKCRWGMNGVPFTGWGPQEDNATNGVNYLRLDTNAGKTNAFDTIFFGKLATGGVDPAYGAWTGEQMQNPPDTSEPTYSSVSINSTVVDQQCLFYCLWADNVALNVSIFSTNNTGAWTNDTAVALSGVSSWANTTKTLNSTLLLVIGYRWYANDTSNNWNDTEILTFITAFGCSEVVTATYNPSQIKSFYGTSRFWVWWSDGTNMVFSSSVDGETSWTVPESIRAASTGSKFSMFYDETYIHYVYTSQTIENQLLYRRGTPYSNGTVVWSAEVVAQDSATNITYASPYVNVDSEGYPWIGYKAANDTDATSYPYATTSSVKDGTWTTQASFPYKLSTASSPFWWASVVPTTNQKVVAVYNSYHDVMRVRGWNGSAWGSEVQTTLTALEGSHHTAVNEGDTVHIAFLCYPTPYNISYVLYNQTANSLGSETILQIAAGFSSPPILCINRGDNYLYCFYCNDTTGSWLSDKVYYKRCVAGVWDTDATILIEEANIGVDKVTGFRETNGGGIGFVWTSGADTPYNIRFEFIPIQTYYTLSIHDLRISSTSDTVNITQFDVNVYYNWALNMSHPGALSSIDNITIRLKDDGTTAIESDAPNYNRTGTYWFRYVNSSDSWEWYNGSIWTSSVDWLNVSGCSYPSKTATQGWYIFQIKLAKSAVKSNQWTFSAIVYGSASNTANVPTKEFVAITLTAYSELTVITESHAWTINQGQKNLLISEGAISFNVTANFIYKMQAKANDSVLHSPSQGYTIAIGNVSIHKDTLANAVSLTTSYADVGDLTNQALGEDISQSLKLWLSTPANQPAATDYTYTLYIQVSEQT